MLNLKKVSKFYYNKGIVASGFSKISLDFDLGEFVAITGESGSGKSTLLNVLSGLDSYEEGEMYINGNETSHYTEKDYEIYRKKYVGNIFQNFNLVSSYTVYQNIELVLLLSGYKKKDIKEKVINIIKDVDLYKYRNRKVSKLSGGQKQRVAIARALAKDTPIILADEPTGNLDSKSSQSVLKLLSEIAKDKLVIIVTHNYEQIEEYVTRKITMHDGKILEDKKIKKYEKVEELKENDIKDIRVFNKLRIGIRNTFNIIPKFLLIFAVYIFIVLSFTSAYSSFKKAQYESSTQGYSQFFSDTSDKRIIIKKEDKTAFTEEDYNSISKIYGINNIVKNDITLDNSINLTNESKDLYVYGIAKDINEFNDEVDIGRLPENENEVIIVGSKDIYYINEMKDELLNLEFSIEQLSYYSTKTTYSVKIVGIKYEEDSSLYFNDMHIYLNESVIKKIVDRLNKNHSTMTYLFAGIERVSSFDSISGEIIPNSRVPRGKYLIPENMTYQCKKSKCQNYKMDIKLDALYYEDSLTLKYYNYYTKNNFSKKTGLKYDKYNGAIFMNDIDYNNLFEKGYYQSSVFLNDVENKDIAITALNKQGYKTLYVKDTLYNYSEEDNAFIQIYKVITLGLLLFALFFISYFIIKIILKSRNIYFATLRILGASSESVKQLLNIELVVISNIAFIIFVVFTILVMNDTISIPFFKGLYDYISISDYLLVYVIMFIMSRIITNRYSRKLFVNTVMNTYKEEV